MLLLPAELPSDEARNADTSVNNKRKAILHRINVWAFITRAPTGKRRLCRAHAIVDT